MFVTKTLSSVELRGQKLLQLSLQEFSKSLGENLPVSFKRLDIRHTKKRCFPMIEFSGLALIGGVTIRFSYNFRKIDLAHFAPHRWLQADDWNETLKLATPCQTGQGKIGYIEFSCEDSSEDWRVSLARMEIDSLVEVLKQQLNR